MNYHLKNGRIVDPASKIDKTADILIVDGVIEKIGQKLSIGADGETIDLKGIVVAPGFIDMHVHFREPGQEHKETIATGSRAAAEGGFTAVCCMPNTNPAIDDPSIISEINKKAASSGVPVDVYVIAAVTKGRQGKELAPMMELADAGALAFTDDGAPVENAEVMRRALEYASMIGKPIIQHAEDVSLTRGGAMNEGSVSTALGMPSMPPVAEEIIVERDLTLSTYAGAAYHVAHISTRGAIEAVRRAKKGGASVTCEVTPHHFALSDEEVRSFDTNTKMNPPLRTKDDIEAAIEGLRDGTIDVIASDHAPHSYDEKQVEFAYAPFGIVGLETAVGLAFTELLYHKVLTLAQIIQKFSINPRKILHLPQLRIKEGETANLTFLDPKFEWKVDVEKFHSKSKNSPFHGRKMKGKAIGIFNKGILHLGSREDAG
ncbi:MAG TPA: dihydroorotase [Bacteroidota bacterium]|nr:dihydroorotase [Bacteroidota bacterium]